MMTFHKHFESIQSMVDFRRSHRAPYNDRYWGSGDKAIGLFLSGDETLVPKAEAYLDKLNDQLPETMKSDWLPDAFGPIVSVPDYLSDSPIPFRRQREIESSCAPVRIITSLTSSASVSRHYLENRGLVILALLLKVQSVRPIDLILYTELDCDGYRTGRGIVSLKIESRPLSVAHAINALANSDVARQIFYGVSDAESIIRGGGYNGGWPEGYMDNKASYYQWLKELFQVTDGDLLIPPTYIGDPIINNPLGWINENLQRMVHFE